MLRRATNEKRKTSEGSERRGRSDLHNNTGPPSGGTTEQGEEISVPTFVPASDPKPAPGLPHELLAVEPSSVQFPYSTVRWV